MRCSRSCGSGIVRPLPKGASEMNRVAVFLFVCFACSTATPSAQRTSSTSTGFTVIPVADAHIDLVEQWLRAIVRHDPGTVDDSVRAIAAWPNAELRSFWIQLKNLVLLMRN